VLAAAATGIGKTVCALLPALRHALRHDAQLLYLTAKTTQRALVADTFVAIAGESGARAVTLRARAEMCPPKHLHCHPRVCPLLTDFEERCAASGALATLSEAAHAGADEIFAYGAGHALCPYELSMLLAAQADLVIGDFNHVFDRATVPSALSQRARRVVIIDEAHNLFDRARGYYSPFVARSAIAQVELVRVSAELAGDVSSWCRALHEALDDAIFAPAGDEGPATIDGCHPVELARERWRELAAAGELLGARHAALRYLRAEAQPDDPLLALAAEVARLAELAASGDRALLGFAADREAERGEGVGILCLDPSRWLERVHRRALGTLAISATLTPLDYFKDVLGFARLDAVVVSAPSPFPREQRAVLIAPEVSTTLRERDAHAAAIARIIGEVYNARAGRYIAFFSSFAYAATVRRELDLPRDEILVQLPMTTLNARELVLAQLRKKERGLLLAVLGGVFGEGIDLPGDALIGAIVVGPGLPKASFERLAMQQHFDDGEGRGFAYAMVYPGLQRVIQAAGRVIRTMHDVGVIVLCDRRFADHEYAECLPSDWYRHSPAELISHDVAGDLQAFWRRQVV
jgi:Rad3-related DNA helicase